MGEDKKLENEKILTHIKRVFENQILQFFIVAFITIVILVCGTGVMMGGVGYMLSRAAKNSQIIDSGIVRSIDIMCENADNCITTIFTDKNKNLYVMGGSSRLCWRSFFYRSMGKDSI